IEPLTKKWQSFGWNVLECDGHDFKNIIQTFNKAYNTKNIPSVIIANTIMGQGVKEIEGNYHWHGRVPDKKEAEIFINQLKGL
ncbi:MAG: transketolase, partial [Bacteroidales bacterium]|nr:transketolase [Bacteroidales bacterium]